MYIPEHKAECPMCRAFGILGAAPIQPVRSWVEDGPEWVHSEYACECGYRWIYKYALAVA